jgi:hypothetical protein
VKIKRTSNVWNSTRSMCMVFHMQTTEERFQSKVRKTRGCWYWTAAKLPKGYGKFGVGSGWMLAHRYAWEQENGPVPTGMLICHTCDNPSCVRVSHLFLGTYGDNNNDRAAKRRTRGWWSTPGAEHPRKGKPSGKKGVPWTEARRAACKK